MKTRLEYIQELRKKSLIIFGIGFVLFIFLFIQSDFMIDKIMTYYNIETISLSPAESISTRMNFSLALTTLFFIPAILYQMFSFTKEMISKKYHKEIKTKVFLGASFSIFGFALGTLIFGKLILGGLMMYNLGEPLWGIASVLKTTALFGLTIAGGIQMIWVIPMLVKTNLVTKEKLKQIRPYLFVGLLIACAFITPPDIFSQVLMMIPIYGSYETGLLFSKNKQQEDLKC